MDRGTRTREATGRGASGDDTVRFLRELRQLRSDAGLNQAELAARAHYPCDYIRAAEAGPALPALPVLAAYVRGCGGTTDEWEERWRSLTSAPTPSELPTRQAAGCSAAATAGARIGSDSPADTPDPSAIMDALNRVAEGMATPPDGPPATQATAAPPETEVSWDAVVSSWEAVATDVADASDPAARIPAARTPAEEPAARTPAEEPLTAAETVTLASGTDEADGPVPGPPGTAAFAAEPSARAAETVAQPAGRPAPAGRSHQGSSRFMTMALVVMAILVLIAVLAVLA